MNRHLFAAMLAAVTIVAGAVQREAPQTSHAAQEGAIVGQVVRIQGQRVTVRTPDGREITLTVPDAARLAAGQRVRIVYKSMGDALLATSVTGLPAQGAK